MSDPLLRRLAERAAERERKRREAEDAEETRLRRLDPLRGCAVANFDWPGDDVARAHGWVQDADGEWSHPEWKRA